MDRKTKIISFIAVLIVVLFAYSVVSIFNENSSKEIAKLEEINADAEAREKAAKSARDSATIAANKMSNHIVELENQLRENNRILGLFQSSYDKNLLELNKLKNEKIFVPDNATTVQQSEFLSNYHYKEY